MTKWFFLWLGMVCGYLLGRNAIRPQGYIINGYHRGRLVFRGIENPARMDGTPLKDGITMDQIEIIKN